MPNNKSQRQSQLQQWYDFVELLRQAFNDGKEEQLLTLLLTSDERDAIGLRVKIVDELLGKNLSQRKKQKKNQQYAGLM